MGFAMLQSFVAAPFLAAAERLRRRMAVAFLLWLCAGGGAADEADVAPVCAFDLPESSYLSAETRAALDLQRRWWAQSPPSTCPTLDNAPREHRAAIRECLARRPTARPCTARCGTDIRWICPSR